MLTPLLQSLAYGWRRLCSRKLYIAAMVVVPVAFAIFFVDLMKEGLPLKVPVSVVDLDQSQLSRRITRNLNATELIDITHRDLSYSEALDRVRRGETFGFFLIPRDFQRDAISGGDATLTFYSDMTVFVPGTLAFKGFKTQAVTTAGGLAATKLTSLGIGDDAARALIQPVVINSNPIGNPWLNYLIYLANSFIPSVLSLMALLLTAYTICDEIKRQTSPQWLHTAGGSMTIALAGKLIPQWAIMTIVGFFYQSVIYGYCNCPLNCPLWHMLLAMALMVMGSQAFAVTICCAVPNLRLSLSICSLTGILTFSIAAYSFPVSSMYPAVGIFSYILPMRYYFLIYADQALNGIPLYYSRWYYAALLMFPIVALLPLRRLKKHCLNPVYVP